MDISDLSIEPDTRRTRKYKVSVLDTIKKILNDIPEGKAISTSEIVDEVFALVNDGIKDEVCMLPRNQIFVRISHLPGRKWFERDYKVAYSDGGVGKGNTWIGKKVKEGGQQRHGKVRRRTK